MLKRKNKAKCYDITCAISGKTNFQQHYFLSDQLKNPVYLKLGIKKGVLYTPS